jgi:hypothetical protein
MTTESTIKKQYCKPKIVMIGNAIRATLGTGSGGRDASQRRRRAACGDPTDPLC